MMTLRERPVLQPSQSATTLQSSFDEARPLVAQTWPALMGGASAKWNTSYCAAISPAQTISKKEGVNLKKCTSQDDLSKPKSSLKLRLRRSLPLLKNIVFLHLPRKPYKQDLGATTKSNATNPNTRDARYGSVKDIKSSKSARKPQRHRHRPSTSTVSTSATRRGASHMRNISGSTNASSVHKPLPTVPGDYSKTVNTERPASSIYSPSVKDLPLPAIQEERFAPRSELHLRPDSTTILNMRNDNPFEGEATQRESTIAEEAPDDNGSTHVHFADQASIVSAPAELQSMYYQSDESASALTITSPPIIYPRSSSLVPSPLHIAPVTKATALVPSPCEADLPTAYLALQRENVHLRTSVTELSALHSKIQSRLPSTLRHLETENSSLRHALIQSEHRYTTLADSLTALVAPNGSSVSLPSSPALTSTSFASSPYSNPRLSTSTGGTSSSSGTLVSPRKHTRSLRQQQHQHPHLKDPPPLPQLPHPPLTAPLRVPNVDKLLHPQAKAKYYEKTSAALPERQRLVQALGHQEDDLERNRGEMRRVKARVGQAEEDMVKGIEEVRRVKREVEEKGGWV
ncbi:hypothetical protein EV356DRAFT_578013 [Viridothelium virens]|uniref:Uncharacterized protein n=1 Tax=Viridothelium virens TaxID=1048519 RepID=A0A6A6H4B7_VIRVR|nr:hypothetical protein EV356DRAFT_578013 [Viridothelium virens]